MNPQRILGIVLIVIGTGLLVIGVNSSNSLVDQVSNTFTGRFTQATTWYLLGGLAAGITGISLLVLKSSKST